MIHGRTATINAHRLKTARRADNTIVLDGGWVVEQGSHDELLAKDGPVRQALNAAAGGTGVVPD